MMKLVCVGKINNTHGLNGEVKVTSDFELKNKIFTKNFKIYIDNEIYLINSYRTMNEYDLLTFVGLDNIDDAINFKNKLIYINREDLLLNNNEYILDDLIDFSIICNNEFIGKVDSIFKGINPLLYISYDKNYYIPINGEYIISVNLEKNEIYVSDNTKELIL